MPHCPDLEPDLKANEGAAAMGPSTATDPPIAVPISGCRPEATTLRQDVAWPIPGRGPQQAALSSLPRGETITRTSMGARVTYGQKPPIYGEPPPPTSGEARKWKILLENAAKRDKGYFKPVKGLRDRGTTMEARAHPFSALLVVSVVAFGCGREAALTGLKDSSSQYGGRPSQDSRFQIAACGS